MKTLPQLQTRAASYMARISCKHFADSDGLCAYHRAILGALVKVHECPDLVSAERLLQAEREANRLVLQDQQTEPVSAAIGGR